MDGAAREARMIGRFAAPDSREDTLDHPVAALPDENRFWPFEALAGSLKPKACVSIGAE